MELFDRLSGGTERDRFAQRVMDGVRAVNPSTELRYDKDEYRLILVENGREQGYMNLGNAFTEYSGMRPEERESCIRNIVRACFAHRKDAPEDFDDANPDLLPTLRNRTYFELTKLQALTEHGREWDFTYQEIGESLGLSLVYDLPEAMLVVTNDMLSKWGVSFYEALEVARHNLQQRPAQIGRIGDGLFVLTTGDSYDATRMVLLDMVRDLTVNGDPIAMVPSREYLLIAGSEDAQSLAAMADLAEKMFQQEHHLISLHAFRLDGDEWATWAPTPDHALHARFRELATRSLGTDYSEQKDLLEKLNEKRGCDEFVASFSGMQSKADGRLTSFCAWTEGIVSLLPRTDRIMFARLEREEAFGPVEWARAVEVVGDLMTEMDGLYPPRFRVEAFPSDEQLRRMGAQ